MKCQAFEQVISGTGRLVFQNIQVLNSSELSVKQDNSNEESAWEREETCFTDMRCKNRYWQNSVSKW